MDALGLLKIRIRRGINLAVRDTVSSDPYVVVSSGTQAIVRGMVMNFSYYNKDISHAILKVKTSVVKDNCNPVWNEELTISIKDLNAPILLSVYDKDTFTVDDSMGNAEIDIKPYVECLKMGLQGLPDGTKVDRVQPGRNNCLSDESCVVWNKGKMTQDMILRLRNVERGEIEVQVEWIDLPGCKGLGF